MKDRAYEIVRNCKYDGYQRALASMVYNIFDKKSTGSGSNKQSESKCKSAEELHEPVIKKLKRRKVYARFKKNIWEIYLAEIELLSSKNKIVNCLLFAIDVCSK